MDIETYKRRESSTKTHFLDGLRGLAAVFVLMHHALLWMHPGYINGYLKHPEQYSRFTKFLFIPFFFFRFGQSAVIFFFVLSGFVIHLRYAKRAAIGVYAPISDAIPFLLRRARRLYPPLILAIIVTFGLDRCGTALGYSVYVHKTPYDVMNVNIGNDHSSRTLVGNLTFLMQTYVPIWGTDSPLWSLKYEWWFYAVYPLTWLLALRRTHWYSTLAIIALAVLSLFPRMWPLALARDVSSKLIIWWFGALLAEVYAGRSAAQFKHLAPLTVLIPIAAICEASGRKIPDWVWGLGFTGVIASGFVWLESGKTLKLLERLRGLGDCSYTLYVIHAPILLLASGWLMSKSLTGELPNSFIPAFCCIAVVPVAYLLHLVVERPFTRLLRRDKSFSAHPPLMSAAS